MTSSLRIVNYIPLHSGRSTINQTIPIPKKPFPNHNRRIHWISEQRSCCYSTKGDEKQFFHIRFEQSEFSAEPLKN
jgi:hypothetical protein